MSRRPSAPAAARVINEIRGYLPTGTAGRSMSPICVSACAGQLSPGQAAGPHPVPRGIRSRRSCSNWASLPGGSPAQLGRTPTPRRSIGDATASSRTAAVRTSACSEWAGDREPLRPTPGHSIERRGYGKPRNPLTCWSGRPDSNRRRPAWEAGILPLNYGRSATSILLRNVTSRP